MSDGNNGRRLSQRRCWVRLLGICGVAAWLGTTTQVVGQVSSASYWTEHSFTFYGGYWPSWGGVPSFWFTPAAYGHTHAYTGASTFEHGPDSDSDRDCGWMGVSWWPPSVWQRSAHAQAASGLSTDPTHSSAVANASVTLQPIGVYGALIGTIHADGSATAVGPGAAAYATSVAAIYSLRRPGLVPGVWLPWQWGWISWSGEVVGGSAWASNPGRRYDPVGYVLYEGGNILEKGEFLSINSQVGAGPSYSWESGIMKIEPGATFTLSIGTGDLAGSADYVPAEAEGRLELALQDGLVIKSQKSGNAEWLSGWLLPPVGTQDPGDFAATDQISVRWNFGREVDAEIQFYGGNIVPEPQSWGMLAGLALAGFSLFRRSAIRHR